MSHPDQAQLDWNAIKNQPIENMKLRDLFIAASMAGLLATDEHQTPSKVLARLAVEAADELMKARQ